MFRKHDAFRDHCLRAGMTKSQIMRREILKLLEEAQRGHRGIFLKSSGRPRGAWQ
jgi:hypothetical protein